MSQKKEPISKEAKALSAYIKESAKLKEKHNVESIFVIHFPKTRRRKNKVGFIIKLLILILKWNGMKIDESISLKKT